MGKIITFYSYKGGVGRTMCLANIGYLLYQWGHNVLLVDWDLEAPGLENFYQKDLGVDITLNKGIIDLLKEMSNVQSSQSEKTSDTQLQWQHCTVNIYKNETTNYYGEYNTNKLDLLTSGLRDDAYFEKVRSFDVKSFYEQNKGGAYIEQLRNEWKDSYDYVLVDSRTGITDTSGICTIQLPDILVLLFTATEQGFAGIRRVAESAIRARQKFSDRTSLLTLPIPTRLDNSEKELTDKWINHFSENLDTIYNTWLNPKSDNEAIDRIEILTITKVPYIAYYSYGEPLPVADTRGTSDPTSIGYTYQTIAALLATNLNYPHLLIKGRDRLLHLADRHFTNKILDDFTNSLRDSQLISRWSSEIKSLYNDAVKFSLEDYTIQEILNQVYQAPTRDLINTKIKYSINERTKELKLAIFNSISKLLNDDLISETSSYNAKLSQDLLSITKLIAANIYISIQITYGDYIYALKDGLTKRIAYEIGIYLNEIKEIIEPIGRGLFNLNDIDKIVLDEQTKWLSFEFSKKINDRLSYYIEDKISINEVEEDVKSKSLILESKSSDASTSVFTPKNLLRFSFYSLQWVVYAVSIITFILLLYFIFYRTFSNEISQEVEDNDSLRTRYEVLQYKDSANTALQASDFKKASLYYNKSIDKALKSKDITQAIIILKEQFKLPSDTISFLAGSRLDSLLEKTNQPAIYKIDIFYSFKDLEHTQALSNNVATVLATNSRYVVRQKLLTGELINTYNINQNAIKYNQNNLNEKNTAVELQKTLNGLVTIKNEHALFKIIPVQKGTPRYLSIFIFERS